MFRKKGFGNKFLSEYLIFALILLICVNCKKQSTKSEPEPEPGHQSILFIGSSYFNYNDLPGLMKKLTNNNNKNVSIHTAITNGLYLSDHANKSSTEAKINEKNWDYVILQGVGRITAYPETYSDHPVYPSLVTLRDKIFANCDSTKMVFCLPWAYEDGMTWLEGWTDTYEDMQRHIYVNTLKYSHNVGFIIAPVGWAWNTVLKEKNYPLHYLHKSDWNHPSLKGSYLMACVIYATIFQQDLSGINYYAGLPEGEAKYFHTVAASTVLDSLELWNIIPLDK